MNFRTGFLRGGGALAALVLFFAAGAAAETTNTLSDAEIQGRQLAQQLLEQTPATNSTQTGILIIRDAKRNLTSLQIEVDVNSTEPWTVRYDVKSETNREKLEVFHDGDPSQRYFRYFVEHADRSVPKVYGYRVASTNSMVSFANSDFWLCDLGLEFFHWPAQKVLPKPTNLVRGREYTLLESTNPNPSTNGYSRVLSWIDTETGGILQAEAYDASGKLLKEFTPKSFKKVNGQWELQEMEIRNVQTGSRTRLEFDLNKQ
jgi:hypothetical protein